MTNQHHHLTTDDTINYAADGVFSPAQALNDEEKNAIYTLGYLLYNQAKYTEAAPFFTLLSISEPNNAVYYIALAACHKMNKNYLAAIQHYSMAVLLAPDRLEHIIDIAECQIANLTPDHAVHTLSEFLAATANSPIEAKLIKRAETLLKLINTENKNSPSKRAPKK